MPYDKAKNYLYIGMQLPSLNEYINKCRTNPHVGAEFKRITEENIAMWINNSVNHGNLHPVTSPCEIVIDFYEKNKRRDVDNVQSATKFILDALQTTGILPNDNQKWVKQVFHRVLPSALNDFVYVYLVEDGNIELRVTDERICDAD